MWADNHFKGGYSRHPQEGRFGHCCAMLIQHLMLSDNLEKKADAVTLITESLMDDDFIAWCGTWRTDAGEHPGTWLEDQLSRYATKEGGLGDRGNNLEDSQ